jgi:transcriptional regulator of acetoin/glycerol metabolism
VVAADGSVAAARERAEREMIVATLARNHGEVASTARELQISRTTLWRLMKKHQI